MKALENRGSFNGRSLVYLWGVCNSLAGEFFCESRGRLYFAGVGVEPHLTRKQGVESSSLTTPKVGGVIANRKPAERGFIHHVDLRGTGKVRKTDKAGRERRGTTGEPHCLPWLQRSGEGAEKRSIV